MRELPPLLISASNLVDEIFTALFPVKSDLILPPSVDKFAEALKSFGIFIVISPPEVLSSIP